MVYKVAIIEDDPTISEMYRLKFKTEGYIAKTAANGRLGLELIQALSPDVVLLDLMMPEMDGRETLLQIRQTEWGRDLRVIILTNADETEIAEDMEGLNVSGLIIKAEDTPAQVVEKVKSVLAS